MAMQVNISICFDICITAYYLFYCLLRLTVPVLKVVGQLVLHLVLYIIKTFNA